jgi:hypothetical protein
VGALAVGALAAVALTDGGDAGALVGAARTVEVTRLVGVTRAEGSVWGVVLDWHARMLGRKRAGR